MAPVLRHCPCLRPETEDVRILDYSHSNLDDVPNEVFGFERTLEELNLDANQIKDLPRPLFHCHGLRKLNLSDNEVQTLPSAVASLVNLELLDISKNGVLEIPDHIKACKCLTVIDASVNPLGKLPEGFTHLINLQELYLNDTFLEYLPANFGRLTHLKILELRENHLKLLPKSMSRLTELSRLDIGQNDFADLPEVIGNLPRLVELWCDCNNLNSLPPFLGGLKKLAYLDASKNKIYEVAEEIEGCTSLCDLTLSSNRIKVLPDGIANLRKITVLRVDENRLISVPENIGNLCNLEELVLSSNDLKTLPPSVGLLRNLRTLIADDNLLDELPCEMGSCVKLTIMSLRDNKLVFIPDELGHIAMLKVINLSGNLLQYLPFSIAKLPNLQALWLSENQNKPLIPLQSDTDRITGQKVLTCFMLPQVPLEEEEYHEVNSNKSAIACPEKGRHIIKFAFDAEIDQPSKLVRAPTPYPKELKAHARHARNYALKKQGSKDLEGNEIPDEVPQLPPRNHDGLHASGVKPDIMMIPTGSRHQELQPSIKEAIISKPKSPLSSPPKHERHYIKSIKDQSSSETSDIQPHSFLEQNPLQVSQPASSDILNPDVSAKVLGRRDSRGDGSSSENTSTSATGSPKSTPDCAVPEGHVPKEKEAQFKKNIPVAGAKKDTWMRQRLLRQGSGDSDRGYRSDHEVYMAERDQYGQCYHDGYASDWEAFLAKQNYVANNSEAIPNPHPYMRSAQNEMGYRGHAEGQEIKDDLEGAASGYNWDPRFQFPNENPEALVEDPYQARMMTPYGYWQMDPVSGQFFLNHDMSQSYPPGTEERTYVYPRCQRPDMIPMQPQNYYDESETYKQPPPPVPPHFWMPRPPNPGTIIANNPPAVPRRLGAASPRMKRSQCLSVQAPLHGTPQEYHLMPHQHGNIHHPSPNTSPRPGRSPSPGIETRGAQGYSPQPYTKYAQPPRFQYPPQSYPITTQPVNAVHFPLPPTNIHPQYQGSYQDSAQMYSTISTPSHVKQMAHQYMRTVDDSALLSRPYPAVPHGSSHNPPNSQGDMGGHRNPSVSAESPYSSGMRNSLNNPEMINHMQGAEYGAMMTGNLHYRSGSIPAQIQNIDQNCDIGMSNEMHHMHRSVPSINVIPSTSPPQTSYMTSGVMLQQLNESWRDDPNNSCTENSNEKIPSQSNSDEAASYNNNTSSQDSNSFNNAKVEVLKDSQAENDSTENENMPKVQNFNILPLKSPKLEKVNQPGLSPNSHVVISPKPSKIICQQNPNQATFPPINRDNSLPLQSSEGLHITSSSNSGCFQAVPISIPTVHSVLNRKNSNEESKLTSNQSNETKPKGNTELKIHDLSVTMQQENQDALRDDEQDSILEAGQDQQGSHTNLVSGMVNRINASVEAEIKKPHNDKIPVEVAPVHSHNVHANKSNIHQSLGKNENEKPPQAAINLSKPGYPARNSPTPIASLSSRENSPNLPKRNKAMNLLGRQNTFDMGDCNKVAQEQYIGNPHKDRLPRQASFETAMKVNVSPPVTNAESFKYTYHVSKIALENSKNSQITHHNASHGTNANSENLVQHENDKSRSADKRFQKVLPPIDTTFQLKPCSARKSGNAEDYPISDCDSLIVQKDNKASKNEASQNTELNAKNVPPVLPPKCNSSAATVFKLDKIESENLPPIPPKRSNLSNSGLSSTHVPVKEITEKKIMENNQMFEKNLAENEKSSHNCEVDGLKQITDIKDEKDVNNEQHNKSNMPDLLSKIVPDEKQQLILIDAEKDLYKNMKNEDNFYYTHNEVEKNMSTNPDSPKSPKRHSWFLGTHKNSMVFPVIILKNPELGFSIEGGIGAARNSRKPNDNGIYVSHVLQDGPANSLLRPGDKILQVDGTDFTHLDHNKAIAVLQESGATVSLMISRE